MAMNRETIISLHIKSENNSTIAKSFQLGVKRFGKWSRSSGRQARHPIDRARAEREQFEPSEWLKTWGKQLRTNPRCSATKLVAEAGIGQIWMRCILEENLKTFPYKTQKRHELTPTHKRMRVERCWHLLNLMEDGMLLNLMFYDEKKFDVEQCVNHQNDRVWGRNASVEGRKLSRRQNPTSVMVWAAVTATGRSPLVFVSSGVKLISQLYISDILEGELFSFCPGPVDWMSGLSPWTSWPLSKPFHAEFEALLRWSNYSHLFMEAYNCFSGIAIEILLYI